MFINGIMEVFSLSRVNQQYRNTKIPEKMEEQAEEKIVVKEEIYNEEETFNTYLQEDNVKKENIEIKGN